MTDPLTDLVTDSLSKLMTDLPSGKQMSSADRFIANSAHDAHVFEGSTHNCTIILLQSTKARRAALNSPVHIKTMNAAAPKPFAQMVSHLVVEKTSGCYSEPGKRRNYVRFMHNLYAFKTW